MRIVETFTSILCLFAAIATVSCGEEWKPVSRIWSPDRKIEAVCFSRTLTVEDQVYLYAKGSGPRTRVLVAENPAFLKLEWTKSQTLVIRYDAQIRRFKNFWVYKVDGQRHQIEIKLQRELASKKGGA